MADPHADLVPDHLQRLGKFIEKTQEMEPDFIIQLGDFCFPKMENQAFVDLWNQFSGPKYHVLGNHDMDISSKEETMSFWKMPERYYSFDMGGAHFIVLDANNIRTTDGEYLHYENANFYIEDRLRTYIDPTQIEWLRADLEDTTVPTFVFSHQSLINPCWGIKNRVQVQQMFEAKNQDATGGKVIACFNGHDHIDYHRKVNGIHYLEINSMSYQWLGAKYSNKTRYPAELYEQYSSLGLFAPYRDSLYTFVTIDLATRSLSLTGLQSDWIAPSPSQLGVPPAVEGCAASPFIIERTLAF